MTPTALITGGTSGIGRAVARKLAQLGIHVLVVGRNVERGEKTIAEIRTAGGQADFIASDLRDASSSRQVAKDRLNKRTRSGVIDFYSRGFRNMYLKGMWKCGAGPFSRPRRRPPGIKLAVPQSSPRVWPLMAISFAAVSWRRIS
jgi:short chain dehydrogenase